jgi:DNA-directed RNA polymerase specialized sigma24 family protein
MNALGGFRTEHLGLEPIRIADGREERYQRAVQLRKLGMKHTEIGEVLGITYSAVSRLLSRRRPVAPR